MSLVKAHSFQCILKAQFSASQQRNEFEVLAQVSTSVFPQRPHPSILINFLAFRKKNMEHQEGLKLDHSGQHIPPPFYRLCTLTFNNINSVPFLPTPAHQSPFNNFSPVHLLLQGTVFIKISELEPKSSLPQLFSLAHIPHLLI